MRSIKPIGMGKVIKLLVVTTLYPNSVQPRHGIFVETRLRQLRATGMVNAEVIAPVPWFPFKSSRFGQYGKYARVPNKEVREEITIHHPRYLVVPKIGMLLTPFFLAFSIKQCISRQKKQGLSYDLVDAHYYFPDGVAIALLKRFLNKPFTITARGTDINLIPNYRLPKQMILWAARRASASITVSKALKECLIQLGVDKQKIHALQNGVSLDFFKPLNRNECKAKWNVAGKTLLSVGNLIESKGHHLVIEALKALPEYQLLIVGDGELKYQLENQVADSKLKDRVKFLGTLTQDELVEVYSAAELLILASSREGMPNVLLEAISCGTPVLAANVGGAAEIIDNKIIGRLLLDRSPAGIIDGVQQVVGSHLDREKIRAAANFWSWDKTVERILSLYDTLIIKDGNFLNSSSQTNNR